jgi:hypothetical protein
MRREPPWSGLVWLFVVMAAVLPSRAASALELRRPGDAMSNGSSVGRCPPALSIRGVYGSTTLGVFVAGASGAQLPLNSTATASHGLGAGRVVSTPTSGTDGWALLRFDGAVAQTVSQAEDASTWSALSAATPTEPNITTVLDGTNLSFAAPYRVPSFNVQFRSAARYRCTVTVTGAWAAAPVAAPRVVAYTHLGAARYRTVAGRGCVNATANASVACAAAGAVGAAGWTFEVAADVPEWYRRDVAVRLHFTAANAAPWEVLLRLAASQLVGADVLLPPGGTLPPQPPAVTAAAPTESAATASSAHGDIPLDAAFAGLFTLTGGCAADVVKLPILLVIAVCFVALIALRLVVRCCAAAGEADDVCTRNHVSALQSVLRQHVWVGAAAPCHAWCGATHAALLAVHVLLLTALAAAFAQLGGAPLLAPLYGVAAALVAAVTRPLFNAPFAAYSVVAADGAARPPLPYTARERYAPEDLAKFGVGHNQRVGVSHDTLGGLADLEYDADVAVAAGVSPASTALQACPKVVSARATTAVGFLLCGAASLAAATATFAVAGPWCDARAGAFDVVLLSAVAADIIAVQPLFAVLVLVWRRMARGDGGAGGHELHPIHGQRVVEAPLAAVAVSAAANDALVLVDAEEAPRTAAAGDSTGNTSPSPTDSLIIAQPPLLRSPPTGLVHGSPSDADAGLPPLMMSASAISLFSVRDELSPHAGGMSPKRTFRKQNHGAATSPLNMPPAASAALAASATPITVQSCSASPNAFGSLNSTARHVQPNYFQIDDGAAGDASAPSKSLIDLDDTEVFGGGAADAWAFEPDAVGADGYEIMATPIATARGAADGGAASAFAQQLQPAVARNRYDDDEDDLQESQELSFAM